MSSSTLALLASLLAGGLVAQDTQGTSLNAQDAKPAAAAQDKKPAQGKKQVKRIPRSVGVAFVKVLLGDRSKETMKQLGPIQRGSWGIVGKLCLEIDKASYGLSKAITAEGEADEAAMKVAKDRVIAVFAAEGKDAQAAARAKAIEAGVATKKVLKGLRQRILGQRKNLVLQFVSSQMRSGARFAGQYRPLRHLGSDVGMLILDTVENPPQRVNEFMRATLLGALRDTETALSDKTASRISDIATDDFEDEGVMRMAMYVLHTFKKPDLLAKYIKTLTADTQKKGRAIDAWSQLAEVHWQVGRYGEAVKCYDALLALEGELPAERVPTMYYNKACSLTLGGKIDDAFATLEIALQKGKATLSNQLLWVDGDIKKLREDERFVALMKKFGRPTSRKEALTPPKKQPEPKKG